ncbi:LuxR family transcriptional regulator [Erwinia sp. P6884]|uniref:helix-turn-helix transcriptional regulator n=1 Tax=Erwinia sp. P6884 TaxID=3141450 RepID=UPI0031936C4D
MFSVFSKNNTLIKILKSYIERKIPALQNQQYAYLTFRKNDPSDVLIISTYPEEWVELYLRHSFQLTDPVIIKSLRQSSPFALHDNITLMAEKFFLLSEKFNIINGITFILHDHHNSLSLLSIAFNNNVNLPTEKQIVANFGFIQLLLIDINAQMYKLIESTTSTSLINKDKLNKPIFTARENEVLYWASMGKTYIETAFILNISLSTVKFHMGNIVKKLRVTNARQAIRLGVELNLIRPAVSAFG